MDKHNAKLKDLLVAAELPWQVGAVLADCGIVHEYQLYDLEAKGHLLRSLRDAQLDEHHINRLRRALQQRDAQNTGKLSEKTVHDQSAQGVPVEEEMTLDPEAATAMDTFSAIIDESTDESAEEALRKAEGRPTPPPFGRAAETAPANTVALPAKPGCGVPAVASPSSVPVQSASISSSGGSCSSPSSDINGTTGEGSKETSASGNDADDQVEQPRRQRLLGWGPRGNGRQVIVVQRSTTNLA